MDASDALFLVGLRTTLAWTPVALAFRDSRPSIGPTPQLRFGDIHRGRGVRGDSDVIAFSPRSSTDVLGNVDAAARLRSAPCPRDRCRRLSAAALFGPFFTGLPHHRADPCCRGRQWGRNNHEALLNGAFRELKVRMR